MAVSYQQQALLRKVIYTALILVLFTVSLLHRRLVLEPRGNDLLIREVSRGEVKLTDKAVSLALTGSRGIAVTFLWSAAIDKQKRHEWNELDLLVSSITRLQPHFVTPWLFQSWNLAFNVAVECDRPRDKYFYISRGLEVLAEGERRNFKPPAPGNPDMRQNLGFYYQLKIGTSDEKNTMRCLLEMSCIDPIERDADRFWEPGDFGKTVKLERFKNFCIQHPRLVRRLYDQLGRTKPEDVVRFLEENKDIPSRFEQPTGPQQTDSIVKDELEQFPILPPGRPSPKSKELSTENVDVFWVCRQWFEYAQKPLPEPNRDTTVELTPNPLVKRMPRYIAVQIFRGYPARAQAYIAENLEAEGWFDKGWLLMAAKVLEDNTSLWEPPPPKWFDKIRRDDESELRVGAEPKYHAGPSWDTAYRMYKDYGYANGLYLEPPEKEELNRAAELYRRTVKIEEGQMGPPKRRGDALGESYHAHARLHFTTLYTNMTNFPEFITQTDAERTAECVTARKFFFNAERIRRAEDPERAIPLYNNAWQFLTHVLLAKPGFARLANVQEDAYEIQIPYNIYVQKHRGEVFEPLLIGMAQLATWPHPTLEKLLTSSQRAKIMPVRNHRGLLDYLLYYESPNALGLKMALVGITGGPMPSLQVVTPTQVYYQLTRHLTRGDPLPKSWRTFVDEDTVSRVRDRLGLNRAEKTEKK